MLNEILTVVLFALIAIASIGAIFIVAVAVVITRHQIQTAKELKKVRRERADLLKLMMQVKALQSRVHDQAVEIASREIEDFLQNLNKE